MELLTVALDSSACLLPPYGLQQHPMLWGHNSHDSPAASEDCDSVMSDLTELTAPYLSRPAHRTRKQEYPSRAPMYSNTGAVIDTYQLQQQCTHRSTKPAKSHKQHISSLSAVIVSKGRVLHGAAAAARNSKKTNPCSGPCDNCGATNSPQWRHGSKSKPIVCNACGIRFLRTGSFDKAVDKKRCGTPNSIASGPRLIKRSKMEGTTTSVEDDDQQVTSAPTPARSDAGQSCIDSRAAAAAAEPATTSRRTATPPIEDAIADATAGIAAFSSKSDQAQQQQVLQQQMTKLAESCVASVGASPVISPASTGTSYHPGAFQPSQLALGPPATNSNSSSSRMVTTGSNGGRTGQQQCSSRAAGSNNGCGFSRHGPSPLSVASNGQVSNRPSRFGAPIAALQAFVAATSGGKSSMQTPASKGKVSSSGSAAAGAEKIATAAAQRGLTVSVAAASAVAPWTTLQAPLLGAGTVAAIPGKSNTPSCCASGKAAGAVPAATISPELIQMVQRLAGVLGSVDAAIAFIKSLSNKNNSTATASTNKDAATSAAVSGVVAAGEGAAEAPARAMPFAGA